MAASGIIPMNKATNEMPASVVIPMNTASNHANCFSGNTNEHGY